MHIRTDFYNINDKIHFGKLTLYPEGGTGKFTPDKLAVEMWKKMNLDLAYKEHEGT